MQIQTDRGYTLSASGTPLRRRKGFVAEELSPIQNPDAPTLCEKCGLAAFDPRIIGLSGTEPQIAAAARSFRVFYRRVPVEGGNYTMDHSASVFLLDAAGRFAGTIDHQESERVALEKLRLLVGRG
ncbi:MAG TPA: SCO family protein [Phenylobacterium sp.]